MNLSDEEKELLRSARDAQGEIERVDNGFEAPWILVGGKAFTGKGDPEITARYRSAFDSLLAKGLVERHTGWIHILTGSGWKTARSL